MYRPRLNEGPHDGGQITWIGSPPDGTPTFPGLTLDPRGSDATSRRCPPCMESRLLGDFQALEHEVQLIARKQVAEILLVELLRPTRSVDQYFDDTLYGIASVEGRRRLKA